MRTARSQEAKAAQSRCQPLINAQVKRRAREKQSNESNGVDDRCSDISAAGEVWPSKSFGSGPDHKRYEETNNICYIAEDAQDQAYRDGCFTEGF